jgi:transposase
LDEAGKIILEQKVSTTPEAIKQTFGKIPRSLIALETGTHSPWVSRLLTELGHEVLVAHAQKVQLITKSNTPERANRRKVSAKQETGICETMMVQGAHYILGPLGEDSDLRRWGWKLAERGEKNAKNRAVVAVARKLAVLLHRLWASGEVYEPLRNSQKAMRAVA